MVQLTRPFAPQWHDADQRGATITFVGLVFEELGYSGGGRMSAESLRAAWVLLSYRGSL